MNLLTIFKKPLQIRWLNLVFFCLVTPIVSSSSSYSLWTALSQKFCLDHEIQRPEIQAQIRWLIKHPQYLQQLSKAEPYIYHIMSEINKRHLPGELALLPMIESAYNPFAYSGAGAAGLWQIMPATGSDFGLTQDWWFDARRSIPSSTQAALNYLEHLHHMFDNNWILAFAAYDAGEGAISRIIKENHHADFWTLPLPKETQAYVPRLFALAEIIQHPENYLIHLPPISHLPYFQEVTIGSQIDLNHAAELAGISYHDLLKLNPGYNHWATAPNQPYKLLIPASHVAEFSNNLSRLPRAKRISWTQYRVMPGDSLNSIALTYHSTTTILKGLNQLKTNRISVGQLLIIPNNHYHITRASPISHFSKLKEYKVVYIVEKQDDLAKIAKKLHVSIEKLKAWNNITQQTNIQSGQNLILWRTALN